MMLQLIYMRRGNTSWINETRKKAKPFLKRNDKCHFGMPLMYILFKDMLRSKIIYMTIVRMILA